MSTPFDLTPDIADAVIAHMNGDHAADNVVICRGIGGRRDVTAARLVALDLETVTFAAETPDGPAELVIDFSEPLADRAQIRAEVADMFHRSEAMLADVERH